MDLQFFDSDEVPAPKDEVRLRALVATPLSGGQRVRVEVEITPFLERPTVDLALLDPAGQTISRSTIVEADHPRLSVTMHLRRAPQQGEYAVRGSLSYPEREAQDVREASFSLTGTAGDDPGGAEG